MNILIDILRTLGRIEGQVQHIPKLSDRVAQVEMWQSWQKGAWAVLMVVLAYLFKQVLIR